MTTTTGPGDRHRPATSGALPHTAVSSMTLLSSIAPNAAANSSRARQLDHIGSTRTAARSSAGDGWRNERHTASAIAHPALTVAITTFAPPEATGSSIRAHTKAPTPNTRHSAPNRSGTPAPVGMVLASTQGPAARASNPSGTLTKKIHRQDNSTSIPPTGGPSAAAMAPTADQVLTAAARRDAGTAASNSASELGMSIAAP